MGEVKPGSYQLTSAPLVAGDLVIVGGRVADNVADRQAVRRGARFRRAHRRAALGLGSGQPGHHRTCRRTGQTYTRGTPNVWAPMSYDAAAGPRLPADRQRHAGLLWAAQRTPLDDKYSSSIVALDATTGKERWVYQTVHHDLWDFDVPMQPTLYRLSRRQGRHPAGAAAGHQGRPDLRARPRDRQAAHRGARSVPVTAGNVPDERYSPTQPFSVGMPQIGAQTLTESDMWGATPFDQLLCRIQFKGMRYDGLSPRRARTCRCSSPARWAA